MRVARNVSGYLTDMSKRDSEDYEMQSFRESEVYPLMPLLREGVLHTTNIQGYQGIRQSGKILPNNGKFPLSYPQSEYYYGCSMGWICLFDFESAREEDYIKNHPIWADFFANHKPKRGPATIVLKLNRQKLADKLIPNSVRPKPGEPGYKPAIAYVEAWYPEAIPTSAIDSYIITSRNSENRELEFQEFPKEDLGKLEEKIFLIQNEELNSLIEKLLLEVSRKKPE